MFCLSLNVLLALSFCRGCGGGGMATLLNQSAMMQTALSMAAFLPPRAQSEPSTKCQLVSLSLRPSLKSCSAQPKPCTSSSRLLHVASLQASASETAAGYEAAGLVLEGGGNGAGTKGGAGSGGGGGGDNSWGRSENESGGGGASSQEAGSGLFGAFWRGWQARVKADPQFAYKVLMEEVIGVGACVLGDMASRPNFGLNELDFVFSTIVVGSILNFTLMYMLAPTTVAGSSVAAHLPGIFASCPAGHMFEPGRFSFFDRAGTFVYKGVQFAVVGFAAGLVGTALSNVLLSLRKKVDPNFVPQNQSPPTVLNAATWALHMGLSSNLRYQTLNGLEFSLAGWLNPAAFKSAVVVLRGLNNVLGGTSFVLLARLTGSQSSSSKDMDPLTSAPKENTGVEDQTLVLKEHSS